MAPPFPWVVSLYREGSAGSILGSTEPPPVKTNCYPAGVAWLQACRPEDVGPESARVFAVGGRPVLVVRSGGAYFASSPRCPHLGMSLENGEVLAGTVRCRAHGYKLDLASGDCLTEKGLRLEVYRAQLRDGWVVVELA